MRTSAARRREDGWDAHAVVAKRRRASGRREKRSPPELAEGGKRLKRLSKLYVALAAAVVTLVAAATLVATNGGFSSKPEAAPVLAQRFAEVRRADLVATETLDGVVTLIEGEPVINRLGGTPTTQASTQQGDREDTEQGDREDVEAPAQSQGTLTAQAATGSRVERGGTLFSVDGAPVVLFYGTIPAWRTLQEGVPPGTDVRQLEDNLKALGFAPGSVDDTFTSSTASAVRAWQSRLGLLADGVLQLGRVVFLPGPITVSQQMKPVGAPIGDGEEILRTRTDSKMVTVTREENELDLLAVGDEVTVTVAGTRIPAKVSSVETGGQEGESTVIATVIPDDPSKLSDTRDGASARVEIITDSRQDVLVVPVTALLAQSQGGYGVQVERNGKIVLVPVKPGLFGDDDLLEVTGDLREGDRVVIP